MTPRPWSVPTHPTLRRGGCTVVFIGTAGMLGALCMCIQITQRCWHRSQTATCRLSIKMRRYFFNRYVIDDAYGGLALEDEGNRCAQLFSDPKKRVMIMGNHGLLVIGHCGGRYLQSSLLL